jgi:hypothetical protein
MDVRPRLFADTAAANTVHRRDRPDRGASHGCAHEFPRLLFHFSWTSAYLPVMHAVGPDRADLAKRLSKQSTAANMSPSDAPSFSMMRCHWHCSGALLLMLSDGDMFDHNLDSLVPSRHGHAAGQGDGPLTPAHAPESEAWRTGQLDMNPAEQGGFAPFGSPVEPARSCGTADGLANPGELPDPFEANSAVIQPHGELWFGPFDAADEYSNEAAVVDAGPEPQAQPDPPEAKQHAVVTDAADAIVDPYEELDPHLTEPKGNEKPFKQMVPKTPKCGDHLFCCFVCSLFLEQQLFGVRMC